MPDPKLPDAVVPESFVAGRHCPTLLSHEREDLVRYLRMTPAQRWEMLQSATADPRASGSLIHALRWLYTA